MPRKGEKIEAILFIEFDNAQGIILSHVIPKDFHNSQQLFKNLECYFVAKPQLNTKLIVTKLCDMYQTLGIPMSVQHNVGEQNNLIHGRCKSIFNVVFVTNIKTDTKPYEKILFKLANYFKIFEQDNNFLSLENFLLFDRSEERKDIKQEKLKRRNDKLESILRQIYENINNEGCCLVAVDDVNDIRLSYSERGPDPQKIRDSDVPIFTGSIEEQESWDLTLKQLFPLINGKSPVTVLSERSRISLPLVKKCVQSLLYYKLANVISPIQYSSLYFVTKKIAKIVKDRSLQDECRQYVQISSESLPEWAVVFRLLVTFQAGGTLKQMFMHEKPFLHNINERRLVEFGLLKGIIKKLHKYPIKREGDCVVNLPSDWYPLLDGQHSYDDICCELKLPLKEVQTKLELDNNLTIITKLGI